MYSRNFSFQYDFSFKSHANYVYWSCGTKIQQIQETRKVSAKLAAQLVYLKESKRVQKINYEYVSIHSYKYEDM